jgi:hypothetical protein
MSERDITPSEERTSSLFTPDTLVPSQFFDRLRRNTEHFAERRLMVAVLEDALDVYRKRCGSRDRRSEELFRDAESWIFSDDDRDWVFSFENICLVLDINPDYIRRGLVAFKRRSEAAGPAVVFFAGDPADPIEPELRRASGQH